MGWNSGYVFWSIAGFVYGSWSGCLFLWVYRYKKTIGFWPIRSRVPSQLFYKSCLILRTKFLDCQTNKTVNIWHIWKLFVVMATNHSMDQDTRASHSKAQEAQAFWSIFPKYFFADFWNVMEDILLNRKPLKNVILQRKKNKTKQNKKKRDQKKTTKLICCGNARLDLW